ncbi:MAG: outer membrane beta-barrel protein [Pseudomonadota bacterium]
MIKRLSKAAAASVLSVIVATGAMADEGLNHSPMVWSGLYVGVHGGYGWGDIKGEADSDDIEYDGAVVGGHIGYNFQQGNYLLGVEADISWSDASGDLGDVFPDDPNGSAEFKTDFLASIRGRAGYVFGAMAVYGTAGVAFANLDYEVAFNDNGSHVTGDLDVGTAVGYVVGGGVEARFSPQLIARIEGLYYDFSDQDLKGASYVDGNKVEDIDTKVDFDVFVLRAGVSLALN